MLNVKRFQSFKMCGYPFLVGNILYSNLLKDTLFEQNLIVFVVEKHSLYPGMQPEILWAGEVL